MAHNVSFARREMKRAGLLDTMSTPHAQFLPTFLKPTASSVSSSTPGYCYLRWFEVFSQALRDQVTSLLGPFPLLRNVLICLLGIYPGDTLLPGLIVVADGFVHVDDSTSVWLSQLCASYLFAPHTRVGVTPQVISFIFGFTSAAVAAAGLAGYSLFFTGEREIAETVVTTVGETSTAAYGFFNTLQSSAASLVEPTCSFVVEVLRPLSDLTLSQCVSFVLRTFLVRPVLFYVRVTMAWPLVTGVVLSYLALPYLSRRFPRRGVLIYYTLMVFPVLGIFPSWVVPICQGAVRYLDALLPVRTPTLPTPEPLPTPVPTLSVFDHFLAIIRSDYFSMAPVPHPADIGNVYDFYTIRVGGPVSSYDDIVYPDPSVIYQPGLPLPPHFVRAGGPVVDDVDALVRLAGVDGPAVVGELARDRLNHLATSDPSALAVPSLSLPKKLPNYLTLRYAKNLPARDVETLQKVYPGLTFSPSDKLTAGSHELNAISRKAETVVLYERYNLFNKRPHIPVSDVGGNVLFGATYDITSVHYCGVVYDVRDGARKTTEQLTLDVMRGRSSVSNTTADRYNALGQSGARCLHGVQKCVVPARVTFEIHVYDISMEQRLAYFDAKKVEKCHQVVFFHPAILLSASGVLRPAGVAWSRWTDVNGVEFINFRFEFDPNTSYTHNYLSYIAPFSTNVVVTPSGRLYTVERNAPRLNQYEVVYTLVSTAGRLRVDQHVNSILYPDSEDFVLITYHEFIPNYYLCPDDPSQITSRRMLVPRDLWEHALRIAYSNVNKRDRLRVVADSLQSFNSRVTIDGASIRTTVRLDPTSLLATAAAADAASFLHFNQLIGGLSAITKAISETAQPHGLSFFDLLRSTKLGATIDSVIESMDRALNRHLAGIEEVTRNRPVNLNDIRSKAVVSIDDEIHAVVRQLIPNFSKYIPSEETDQHRLNVTRARLIAGNPDLTVDPASGRTTLRQAQSAARELATDAPENVRQHLTAVADDAKVALNRAKPTAALRFVRVPGDGSCLYYAMLIGAGFEVRGAESRTILYPECLRAFILRASLLISSAVPDPVIDDIRRRNECLDLIAGLKDELASLRLPISQTRVKTWASVLHLGVFASILNVNYSNYFLTKVKGDQQSVVFPLTTVTQPDDTLYVHMPRMTATTHADAWRPVDVTPRFERRFFTAWTAAFRSLPNSRDSSFDSFTLMCPGSPTPIDRVALKILDIFFHEQELSTATRVLEIGGAPGHWSIFLHHYFRNSIVHTCSPLPMDGSADFDYTPEVITAYSGENRRMHLVNMTDLSVDLRFDLLLSDAATVGSWLDNDVLTDLVTVIPRLLNLGGSVVIKIPNIVIGCRGFLDFIIGHFTYVRLYKPRGSRMNSAEVYLVARGYTDQVAPRPALSNEVNSARLRHADAYQVYVNTCLTTGSSRVARDNVATTVSELEVYLRVHFSTLVRVGGDDSLPNDNLPEVIDVSGVRFEVTTADIAETAPADTLPGPLSADSLFDLVINGLSSSSPINNSLPQSFVDCLRRYRNTTDTSQRQSRLTVLRRIFFQDIVQELARAFKVDGRLHDANVVLLKNEVSRVRLCPLDNSTTVRTIISSDTVGVVSNPQPVLNRIPISSSNNIADHIPTQVVEGPARGELVYPDADKTYVLPVVSPSCPAEIRTGSLVNKSLPTLTSSADSGLATSVSSVPQGNQPSLTSTYTPDSPDQDPAQPGFAVIGTSALTNDQFLQYIRRVDSATPSVPTVVPGPRLTIPAPSPIRSGVLSYSIVIEVQHSLPTFPKTTRSFPRVDPFGNRCTIYQIGDHVLPVVSINRDYSDWTRNLHQLVTFLDKHSHPKPIYVLFTRMQPRLYPLLSNVLHGNTCLRYAFAIDGYSRPRELSDLLLVLETQMMQPVTTSNNRPAFPKQDLMPDVFSGNLIRESFSSVVDLRGRAAFAAHEFFAYQQKTRLALQLRLAPVYDDLIRGKEIPRLTGAGYNLVDLTTGTLRFKDLWGRNFSCMSYAFNGAFIPYSEELSRFVPEGQTRTDWALVCPDTEVMIDEKFLTIHSHTRIYADRLPHFFWLNGPPGCGKTHLLVNNFSLEGTAILTATRAGVSEIQRALTAKLKGKTLRSVFIRGRMSEVINRRVRTIASAMLAVKPDLGVRTVFVDEATMVHPGQIVYASLAFPNADRVIMVGDFNQIPFHDRLHVGILQATVPRVIASNLPELTTTYRCPIDVVYALSQYYANLHTENSCIKSLSIDRSGVVPRIPGALYMTFTRAEKQSLAAFVASVRDATLYTVAEAQGLTYDNVVVVREQQNDIEIYKNVNQAITAISRHRRQMVYSSRATGGALETLMLSAMAKHSDIPALVAHNERMAASSDKGNLRAIFTGLNLRVGADPSLPSTLSDVSVLDTEFQSTVNRPVIVPFLGSCAPWVLGGTCLATLIYYRGPLTNWRLGNLNSPLPIPPSALFSSAYPTLRRYLVPTLMTVAGTCFVLDAPIIPAIPRMHQVVSHHRVTVFRALSGFRPVIDRGLFIRVFNSIVRPCPLASPALLARLRDFVTRPLRILQSDPTTQALVNRLTPKSSSPAIQIPESTLRGSPDVESFQTPLASVPIRVTPKLTGRSVASTLTAVVDRLTDLAGLSTRPLSPIPEVPLTADPTPVVPPSSLSPGLLDTVVSSTPPIHSVSDSDASNPDSDASTPDQDASVDLLSRVGGPVVEWPESLPVATVSGDPVSSDVSSVNRTTQYIAHYSEVALRTVQPDGLDRLPAYSGLVDPDLIPPVTRQRLIHVPSSVILESLYHTELAVPTVLPQLLPIEPVSVPVTEAEWTGSVATIQAFYDEFAPTAACHDYSQDPAVVEFSSIDIHVDKITLDPGRCGYRNPTFDSLLPTLRTMISARRPRTQLETVLGFMKRNGNAPKLMSGYPPSLIADLLFNNFVNSVISPECLSNFYTFAEAELVPSEESLETWLTTQDDPEVIRFLAQSNVPLIHRVYDLFEYMIKPGVKPPTDPADATKYQSVQTIAYQSKDINVIFCPLFIQMRDRLLSVLKNKYLFYSGLSPTELEERINSLFPMDVLFNCERIENDISKYDKSMPAYYLLFECALYRMLGLSDQLVQIWYMSHVRSTYVDRSTGFSAPVDFQRRSGDPSTFLGNTLINLAVCVAIYSDDSLQFALFAGDDHLIFGKDISYSTSGMFADLFNFEAKTLSSYNYPYFCGKFLLPVLGRVYVVPDPVRVITKFGRRDLRNPDHVEQYRVSMLDVLGPLSNILVHDALSSALTERYRTSRTDHSALFHSILALVNSPTEFADLYYSLPDQVISTDPNLPDLDL